MTDIFSPEKRSKIMSSIKGKDTKIEIILRKKLWHNGIRGYRVHFKLPGKPDIVFPKYKVAIFCDGDFWHGYNFSEWESRLSPFWHEKIKRNIERDRKNDQILIGRGWEVLHFWEWEILEDGDKCKQEILDTLLKKGYKQKSTSSDN
ncbi:very short patch repair endonuclease [Methanosarcina sp. T3]|uniref:very short patch repair endonuclease n=1 Tax=Methanosarcina sp. T3 TaxID=3439062 RepID=UPI003F8409FE